MERIDLHMHSKASLDGEFTYQQICEMANKIGIKTIAISDHNVVDSIKDLIKSEIKYDLNLIPGIEIDATCAGVDYHILGYGIDAFNEKFEGIGTNFLNQAKNAGNIMMDKLIDFGFDLNKDDIFAMSDAGIVTGEMVAEYLLEKDKDKKMALLDPYRDQGERSNRPYVNFYWDYCSSGKIAFAPIVFPSVQEIVEMLHEQGAIAVLAHPGQNLHEDLKHLEEVLNCGIDGIEVYSSYHDAQQIAFYQVWAKAYNMLITCGSDFHGATKPDIKLGDHGMKIEEQQNTYDKLKQFIKRV